MSLCASFDVVENSNDRFSFSRKPVNLARLWTGGWLVLVLELDSVMTPHFAEIMADAL
jgi:hypothetical protein